MSREPGPERLKVFLLCSGLGTTRRGYESFMWQCFQALQREASLDAWLFKGDGEEGPQDLSLRPLERAGFGARLVGELTRRGPYVVEQASFVAKLLPHLVRHRPDVVYYCDLSVGKLLWYWRRMTGARFRLVLHNGGPHPAPFRWCDHVHHLTPDAATNAIHAGHDPRRQTLLPCGLNFGPEPLPPSSDERMARRHALGLPIDRPVVLSVGALNRSHKRMDYVIAEIAAFPPPRPFLMMVGQVESETPAVRATAELMLGADGFAMRTVSREEVDRYYRAADVFTLASLKEAFGLGYLEAMSHGLTCAAHDYPVTRFVLNGEGLLADLRRPTALAAELRRAFALDDTPALRSRRHRAARDRFSWSVLAERYVSMFRSASLVGAP